MSDTSSRSARGPVHTGRLRIDDLLNWLRRDGLVRRDAAQAGPRRVEYALTPLGATLAPVMDDLVAWARTNAAAVLTYQSDHPDVTDQEKP